MRFLLVSAVLLVFWAAVWSIVWFRVFNVATDYGLSNTGSKFTVSAKREQELETGTRADLYSEERQSVSGSGNVETSGSEREEFSEVRKVLD